MPTLKNLMLSGVYRLQQLAFGSRAALSQRSRTRWRSAIPSSDLTWGRRVSGDAFIRKVEFYGGFGSAKSILEIGPGYGRLLQSCLDLKVPFKDYYALDISAANVDWLREKFGAPNRMFIQGDAETTPLPAGFDSMMSSLTFKHLYPSFEPALNNLVRFARPNARFFFDLLEGQSRFFERDRITYIRRYSREQVTDMLARSRLELVAFDTVEHDPEHRRLLVVAGLTR
ncbi:MAG: class I SAM-dependent methyltransferase [Chloroflexi bacterium]|nr:MAG: class I SAM-dependent methyltransferase [Chloroflexota bacterium]